MKIKYYGHSCFYIQVGGKKLIFDPFISPNPQASTININSIEADYILISHAHQDHMQDAAQIAKRTGATIIANWEITQWFAQKEQVPAVHPMNIGGQWKFDFGTVILTTALHSSSFPDGSYGGTPNGFYIESNEGNFYYSGDTALMQEMKLLGEYKRIDFAFLPIGDNFTMGISDAVIASNFIKCDKVIGMHFDTFPYIVINKEVAKEKFLNAGKELILMNINTEISSIDFLTHNPQLTTHN
ncbi:MAG: hydrolase [Bacteroidetes bacterium RIFCSPLOWO2_12_FULL_31_6]|nr:MAG: hydrolase [Bacteroidetes bacterium RIFCSPLOWO2_12_FULL_31_6]